MGYLGTVQHIAEDSLELYSMGAFPEPEAGPLEEHLLICATCRDRLQKTDHYVAAVRAAAKGMVVKEAATAPSGTVRRASGQ